MDQLRSSGQAGELNNQSHQEYFQDKVKPIYSNLIVNIVKSKPEDILDFCIKWFRDRKGDSTRVADADNDSENDDNLFETVSNEEFKKMREEKLRKARKHRFGVTSEVYGPCTRRQSIKLSTGFPKAEQTHMRILFFCMNSFLFKYFSEAELRVLIRMMNKRITTTNQIVFEQGDPGDSLYFVDEGIYECFQVLQTGPKSIRYYHVGDTFGEVCLLHLIKRQASIISRSDGILYTLSRESYIHYKKMCITKKRAIYMYILRKQPLFVKFCEQELEKICDVLTEIYFEEGDLIINEGDMGSKFYIILDGILVAFKGKEQNVVQCYKEGDAFGEIALIKDTPRQASVKSLTRSRLVYMTQEVFRRIFENMNLDKEIEEKYQSKSKLGTRRRENCEEEERFEARKSEDDSQN